MEGRVGLRLFTRLFGFGNADGESQRLPADGIGMATESPGLGKRALGLPPFPARAMVQGESNPFVY